MTFLKSRALIRTGLGHSTHRSKESVARPFALLRYWVIQPQTNTIYHIALTRVVEKRAAECDSPILPPHYFHSSRVDFFAVCSHHQAPSRKSFRPKILVARSNISKAIMIHQNLNSRYLFFSWPSLQIGVKVGLMFRNELIKN